MSERVPCPREDPHPGHLWNTPDWKPRHFGDKQYYCGGIRDPAVLNMTDEQLRLAQAELNAREAVARQAREQEEQRQRLLAMGARDLQYRGLLGELLVKAGWRTPSTEPPVTMRLLEEVCDLVEEYQDRD